MNSPVTKCAACAKFCGYIVAGLGTLLIVTALVRVMIDYTRPAPPTEDRAQLRRKNLEEIRNANEDVLGNPNYVWQDEAKGIVRMPLKDAMDLSLKLWQNKDAARSNLFVRAEKAFAVPPKAPSPFE